MKQLRFVDLFAGIGGFRLAFEAAGAKCVWACEIDRFARETYMANFDTKLHSKRGNNTRHRSSHLAGDIRDVDPVAHIPDFDILTAGFPCPTFSIAGISKLNALNRKHGLEEYERGQLFFEIIRILKAKNPSALLLENVKHLVHHNKGRTFRVMYDALQSLGYRPVTWKVFNAATLVPQHRERVFIAGFRADLNIPFDIRAIEVATANPRLKDILERNNEVPPAYTLSDRLWAYLRAYKRKHRAAGNGFGYSVADPEGVSRTMSARYHKDGSEILIGQGDGLNPRMLTEREAARLFGFPEDFIIPVSRTQAYRQFGNSVCVPLVTILAHHICAALEGRPTLALRSDDASEQITLHGR